MTKGLDEKQRQKDSSNRNRKRKSRDNGLGYNLFWGVLFVSVYVNVHFILLQFTSNASSALLPHHHMEAFHQAAKDAFMQRPMISKIIPSSSSSSLVLPVVHNLTQDLEKTVDIASPELMLKTTWQSLLKQPMAKLAYRTITNVVPRKRNKRFDIGDEDITLVTHATVDRLGRLLEQYIRWDGPVSAAVYIRNESEIDTFLAFIHDKGRILKNIAIHVLMENNNGHASKQQQYPTNVLRNLAVSQLETDYLVDVSVNFVTNVGAYGQLRKLMDQKDSTFTTVLKSKTLLVLPAFEWTNNDGTIEAPSNKAELITKVKQGAAQPYRLKKYPHLHGPTRFEMWYEDSRDTYPINYQDGFEPFVMAYKQGLPRYWTGALRGSPGQKAGVYDKNAWCVEAVSLGYRFAVLRDAFVFYVGTHPGSIKIPLWKSREWLKFLEYKQHILQSGNQTTTES